MARSSGNAEVVVCVLTIISGVLAPFVFRVFMDLLGRVVMFAENVYMGNGVTHALNVLLVRMLDYVRTARNALLAHMASYGIGVRHVTAANMVW